VGVPPDLDDQVDCTDDTCDEDNDVAVHTPNNGLCSNNIFCDGAETCDPNQGCQAGPAPPVNDGLDCTSDSCDEPSASVLHIPDDGQCVTGGLCVTDTCVIGFGCSSTTTPNCCGNDVVDNGEACDDGNVNANDGCASDCSTEEHVHHNGQGVTWYNNVSTGTMSSEQAKLSCQKTYVSCFLSNGDCAGQGWCQSPNSGKCWGWSSGCSGGSGRVWLYGNSYTTYGTWD
jgi:cysteine-rich repeat protein